MIMSWHGNSLRITGLCERKFTGDRWIPPTADQFVDNFLNVGPNKLLYKNKFAGDFRWWLHDVTVMLESGCVSVNYYLIDNLDYVIQRYPGRLHILIYSWYFDITSNPFKSSHHRKCMYRNSYCFIHRGRHLAVYIFKCTFFKVYRYILIRISLKCIPKFQTGK